VTGLPKYVKSWSILVPPRSRTGPSAPAQVKVGARDFKGDGASMDAEQAVSWYRRRSRGGLNAGAQFNLGFSCYSKGDGVAKDAEQAVSGPPAPADSSSAHPSASRSSPGRSSSRSSRGRGPPRRSGARIEAAAPARRAKRGSRSAAAAAAAAPAPPGASLQRRTRVSRQRRTCARHARPCPLASPPPCGRLLRARGCPLRTHPRRVRSWQRECVCVARPALIDRCGSRLRLCTSVKGGA